MCVSGSVIGPGGLTAAICLCACLPDLESINGERILYEHSAVVRPCAGTVAYLDRVVSFLERELGVVAPARLRYSWLIDDEEISLPAGLTPKSENWTVGRHTTTSSPALVHEVVHLVAANKAAAFFSEGLAVTYDLLQPNGIGPRYVLDGHQFDPRRTMAASDSLEVAYAEAGFFVSFLLTRHGPEKFSAFYTRLPQSATMGTIRAAFRSAYGAELDDEVEDFMAGPPMCEAHHFAVQLEDCSAPLLRPDGPTWAISGAMSCDSPDVVGGVGSNGGWASFRQLTLEIETAGAYRLESAGDLDVWVRFGPCFGCVWDEQDVWFPLGQNRSMDLAAGKYFLRISGESERTPNITVVLGPA